jgi:large subunit ribosomal protein L1
MIVVELALVHTTNTSNKITKGINMKRSKKYRQSAEKIEKEKFYAPADAISLAKEIANKKYDETVEVVFRLGVDPRKADQMIRGTVKLPNGTGKTLRVLVFAQGEKATQAEEAGADIVGSDELVAKVAGGWTEFDVAVATPDMMGKIGRLGKVLGPRGLMPNPKTGTVTMDVAKAISDIKGGRIEFRADKNGNLAFIIGKVSFDVDKLEENFLAASNEIMRMKPSSIKGKYLIKASISTTMGPGILVDTSRIS